jgi:hypothetical protein
MQVSTNEGGSSEWVPASATDQSKSKAIYKHFAALSNELSTPKIVVCPSDGTREEANNFALVKPTGAAGNNVVPFNRNKNISYFIAPGADETRPQAFLSGDRNVTNDLRKLNTADMYTALGNYSTTTKALGWTKDQHQEQGDICMGDGSVQQMSTSRLKQSTKDADDTGLDTTANVVGLPGDSTAIQ